MAIFEPNIITVVYSSIIIVGLVLCIIGMFAYNSSIPMLTICGYSCLIAGLFMVIGSLISKLSTFLNKSSIENILGSAPTLLQTLDIVRINILPFLIILITLIFILATTINNQDKISLGTASRNYYLFMNLNIIVLCIEAFILSYGSFMSEKQNSKFKSMPLMFSTFSYFLCLFNILFCIIQYNELTYFTTDG